MYVLELGGEDDAFAAREARAAATGIDVRAPGIATATGVAPERVRHLAYTHHASELVGTTDASAESARVLLEASPTAREGSVAVRAVDVRGSTGVDTQAVERALGSILVDRGATVDLVDPDHELRALFSRGTVDGEARDVCALGWQVAASTRDYGDRKPTDRPFFQPGSMDPLLARAIANVAGAAPGRTLLDPMCGTGGVLIEAGLVGARALGNDAQRKMVEGVGRNLATFDVEWDVVRGDATRLALADDAVDCVVFDAPYGRQSKIETHDLDDLVEGALAEARRVARGRCVLVADRDWRAEAHRAGWEIESSFERPVHRSLTRYVLVLE